jgi:isoleucyl-tRNA synthetase
MYAKDSVHLQSFPQLANFEIDRDLTNVMDKTRAICSCALAVRDRNNLRIRLPLNKITIIAEDAENLREFSAIIADEINVKSIEFLDNIEDFAENKLILNFQKIGSIVGSKMPDLIKAAKSKGWKITEDGSLIICGLELAGDEFSLQLIPRKENIFPVEGYNVLIMLDLVITGELECEGAARDLVRLIQKFRKNAAIDIAAVVGLSIKTSHKLFLEAIAKHENYIKEQVLASNLAIIANDHQDTSSKFSFREEIEGNIIEINFSVIG